MSIVCGSGQVFGKCRRVEGRGGQGCFVTTMGEFGGGIGRSVTIQESLSAIEVLTWLQGMQTTVLIFDFGEAQAIL